MYSVVGYIKEMIKSVGIILCMTCTGDKKESTSTPYYHQPRSLD